MKYWKIPILTMTVFVPLDCACQYTNTYSDSITINVGDFYQQENLPVGMTLYYADITLTNIGSQVCYFFECNNAVFPAPFMLRELVNDQWVETPYNYICNAFDPMGYFAPIAPGETTVSMAVITDHIGFFEVCFRWALIENQAEGELFYACSNSFQITSVGEALVRGDDITRPFLNSNGQLQFENEWDEDVILTVTDTRGCLVGSYLAASNSTLLINENLSSGMYIVTQCSIKSGFLNSTKIFKP